ncbi:MAG: enoyl-CoA hydratase/isomerase family protein, partial [Hyphomicrobiales bacterium]|nr:enoyl-CoA hydratase/isomerase family protein [Hyphomicrobiales bacterium]
MAVCERREIVQCGEFHSLRACDGGGAEMSEPPVIVAKDARGVATVAINRPRVRNAIDDTVIRSLTDAFKTLGTDGETRIVVLTGRDVAFSAGADLDWMRRMAIGREAENLASAKTISAMLR